MDLIAENQKNAHAFLIEMLKDIERFNVFSDQDLESLVSLSRFEEHQPGDVIMREGDYDTWVYILIEGGSRNRPKRQNIVLSAPKRRYVW